MNEKTLCILANIGFWAILAASAGVIGVWAISTAYNIPWDIGAYFLIISGGILGSVFGFTVGMAHPMMYEA